MFNADKQTRPTNRLKIKRAIAVLFLVCAVALDGYTLHSVTRIDDLNVHPPIQLVSDARESTALRNSAVGRYATGNEPGDRRIEIAQDGQIRFARIATGSERQDWDDSYRVARTGGKLCLSSSESGLVQITNIDTIVYYRDVYHRIR